MILSIITRRNNDAHTRTKWFEWLSLPFEWRHTYLCVCIPYIKLKHDVIVQRLLTLLAYED